MTLAEQMQEDNNKIAELFESMMQRFNDLGKYVCLNTKKYPHLQNHSLFLSQLLFRGVILNNSFTCEFFATLY